MRHLSGDLAAHLLANNVLAMADLYRIVSPILGSDFFTSWDSDVVYNEDTYYSGRVIPTRDRVRSTLGLDIDQLEMEVGHGGAALFGDTDVTWSQAALSGALDGAEVKLYRGFFAPVVAAWTPSTGYVADDLVTNELGRVYKCGADGTSASSGGPTGIDSAVGDPLTWIHDGTAEWYYFGPAGTLALVDAVLLFGGYVGEVQPKSAVVSLTVESPVAKLQQDWPRAVIQPSCRWTLYDAGCGLTRPGTYDAETVASATAGVVTLTGRGAVTGFVGGSLKVVSPASPLYGHSRAIVATANVSGDLAITVAPTFGAALDAGNVVQPISGCPGTAAVCESAYHNLVHFGGVPMLPPDSTRKG